MILKKILSDIFLQISQKMSRKTNLAKFSLVKKKGKEEFLLSKKTR